MQKRSFLIFFLVICLFASSCSEQENFNGEKNPSFDPEKIETFENDDETKQMIEKRIGELAEKWDPQNSGGEIAKFNNTRSSSHLSEDTVQLLLKCISLSEKTNGLLDITLYPLTRLWGFESDEPKKPDEMLITLMASKCGMDTISVSDDSFALDQFTMLDPSAVTKGFAADLIAEELQKDGCQRAMIELEDHVRTLGTKEDGTEWNVLLCDPFNNDSYFSYVSVDGGVSVSTKGTFRKYFEEDGETYCNIFDPRNGMPVDSDLASVTVICKSGITADAYATACLIMGSEESARFYRENDDFELIMVLENGKIQASEGIADSLVFSKADQEVEVIK